LESDQSESESKTTKFQAEIDRLRTRLAELEKGVGPSTAAMEEWKKDVENRVKIIQKKAMELLDREQKVRAKEEELRSLAQQLGVTL
jgi:molecular chaperone GrpE (heat shock protein)